MGSLGLEGFCLEGALINRVKKTVAGFRAPVLPFWRSSFLVTGCIGVVTTHLIRPLSRVSQDIIDLYVEL